MRRNAPSPSERRIVAGLHRRDPEAVRTLYAEYGPSTLALLRSTLHDRAAAEDVCQQVLLEAWERSPSYDPERASLHTWLGTIARSRAIDHMRRRVPEPRDPTRPGAAGVPAPTTDLVERMAVADMLRQLPHEESQVVWLHYHFGLSQSQIAAHTGAPLGTVKSRCASALRHLRAMLDEEQRAAL
jgi:RNA polymerase sigma-70 factor (ECF subfamily)